MSFERVIALMGLVCSLGYFVKELDLADLPGIPTDYMMLGVLAFGTALIVQRRRRLREEGSVNG